MPVLRRLLAAALLGGAFHAAAAPCGPAEGGALSATYAVRYTAPGSAPATQTWQLQREAQRISWRKDEVEEVWLRQSNGVRLLRVFHADRQVVDYAPGELAALGVAVRWDELAGLLDAASLARLGPGVPQDGPRQGTLGAETVEVDWDATAALPRQLLRRGPGGEVRFERTACAGGAAVASDFAGYGRIDASDFGDMDYDPFVRKAMAYDERHGWRGAHAH